MTLCLMKGTQECTRIRNIRVNFKLFSPSLREELNESTKFLIYDTWIITCYLKNASHKRFCSVNAINVFLCGYIKGSLEWT